MKKLLASVAIVITAIAPNANAGCFETFCGQRVVKIVQKGHTVQAAPFYNSVYYVPGVPSTQQGYLSDDERISRIVAKTVAATLNEMGLQPQVAQARANTGLQKCAKCHGPGKSASDHFELATLDASTAERIQYALVETNMAERAKLTQDEFKQLMIETRVMLSEAANGPPVNALPLENEE